MHEQDKEGHATREKHSMASEADGARDVDLSEAGGAASGQPGQSGPGGTALASNPDDVMRSRACNVSKEPV